MILKYKSLYNSSFLYNLDRNEMVFSYSERYKRKIATNWGRDVIVPYDIDSELQNKWVAMELKYRVLLSNVSIALDNFDSKLLFSVDNNKEVYVSPYHKDSVLLTLDSVRSSFNNIIRSDLNFVNLKVPYSHNHIVCPKLGYYYLIYCKLLNNIDSIRMMFDIDYSMNISLSMVG